MRRNAPFDQPRISGSLLPVERPGGNIQTSGFETASLLIMVEPTDEQSGEGD
jgi:hypothetical protein